MNVMEQSKKKTSLLSDGASQDLDSRLQASTSRGGRERQKLGMLLQSRESDSDDERGAYPLPKPSVQITDDNGGALFLSRRSATENPKSLSLLPPRGSGRTQDPSVHPMLQINADSAPSRIPSGLLYPCNSATGDPNSCLLNAAHFTFDSAILDQSHHNNLTERIFKKLMGQSKQQQHDASKSPNSTLDCPPSPVSSERSFRGKSKKMSLRCRSEDANNNKVATPRPKSQLAQYLRSMTALSGDRDDDRDSLEGPSEAAWLDPDSPYHEPSKKLESWSSTNNSWNLSLNPLKTIVARRGATPGRSSGSRFRKAIAQSSLTGSYDGSRVSRKGTTSEANSGRSWWSEFGSGRKSTSIWACSGRLQAEPAAEADLHEPETKHRFAPREVERPKVDEAAFSFNNPVATTFVFRESEKLSQRSSPTDRISSLHKTTVSGTDSDDLPYSDAYHDPEEGSVTDSDTLSCDYTEGNVALTTQDYSGRRSFDSSHLSISRGISSRALSGFLDMGRSGRSGRFSVDLNRGQKLDKAQRLPTPDVRLRIFAGEKSYKRSILSPCLPFLQRLPHKSAAQAVQPAPSAASSRRIQAVNSFTARLGPVAENPALAGQFHVQ